MNDKNKMQQNDLNNEDQTMEDVKGGESEANANEVTDSDSGASPMDQQNNDQGPLNSDATETEE